MVKRLIETDTFPIGFLSALAERESWRKEIYRPIYHVHKWWAKRLGSVFRGIILGCLLSEDEEMEKAFYERHAFNDTTIFDPFMGSGTTIGEAHKLGCVALGRDINPVACENVRVALGPMERNKLLSAFENLSSTIGEHIQAMYKSQDKEGTVCDVLYYFWVMCVDCPLCNSMVELFSSRIIARNAYPNRKPEVQVCCPKCGDIFSALNTDTSVSCAHCGCTFNPHIGSANRAKAVCNNCNQHFNIVDALRKCGTPPKYRLYGKLLLTPSDEKVYLATTSQDIDAYAECSRYLEQALHNKSIRLPVTQLDDGYNTRQAVNYNFTLWRHFFNDRQLLALGVLQDHIAKIVDTTTRDLVLNLFSGVLEFNNMFASYKGEGTGAVRHMFSHHILKPERMPIEANIWGTSKSSGSFVNMFKMRLMRALEYRLAPFEVTMNGSGKALSTSEPFVGKVHTEWPTTGKYNRRAIYVSSGSSHKTDLPSKSIDFVITDPPFFDNVHYSELADFFFAWKQLYPRGFICNGKTTRRKEEVQDVNADSFAEKLLDVFKECHRILKDDGLLVFTYHHSRNEGWSSLIQSIIGAGFSVINAHPIKAEMSVATPKSQAKEPIQLDIILVCKKAENDLRLIHEQDLSLATIRSKALSKLKKLMLTNLKISRNDVRVTLYSQAIASLGYTSSVSAAIARISQVESIVTDVYNALTEETELHNVWKEIP